MKYVLALFLIATAALAQQPRELTLDDAIAMALEKNGDIVVERESVTIAGANVERAEAAYDPTLRGDARLRHRKDPINSILSGAPPGEVAPTTDTILTSATMTQLLPTGATVSVFSSINRDDTNSRLALLTPAWSTALGAEIRQPLLQNRRIDPVRRAIRIARVDRSRAETSLRRVASDITANVERAYWNLVAARANVGIREAAVRTAEKQREDTRVRIQAGTQAESDVAQTTAEVERRRAEVVSAIEQRTRAENALRNLIARDPLWDEPIVPADDGEETDRNVCPTRSACIEQALANRPELQELALRLDRQDVEIEAALDRTKPQVDLVAAYNGRGLAGSENENALTPFGPVVVADPLEGGFGQSIRNMERFPDASVGVSVALPIGNRAAKQDVAIARAIKRQATTTLEQARQRVAVEVRDAAASVDAAQQRIDAARATREAAQVALQAERDRYTAGTTNLFFVITRENELDAARLAEVGAIADLRRARAELARATGSLLTERSIHIGGIQ